MGVQSKQIFEFDSYELDKTFADFDNFVLIKIKSIPSESLRYDDNALMSRIIVCEVPKPKNRTREEVELFNKLIGRQLFSETELGMNKATAAVTRVNRFFGTAWTTHP